jgi:hypothetical protein
MVPRQMTLMVMGGSGQARAAGEPVVRHKPAPGADSNPRPRHYEFGRPRGKPRLSEGRCAVVRHAAPANLLLDVATRIAINEEMLPCPVMILMRDLLLRSAGPTADADQERKSLEEGLAGY